MWVCICRDCGLVQTTTRMTAETCARFYNEEYRKLYVGALEPPKTFFTNQVRQGQKICHLLESRASMSLQGKRVVEIGCGAGGLLQAFRARGATVLGFDLGEEYLEFGRKQFGLDLRAAGLGSLPLN